MTELMSFEEFLKENEKTAKIYAKQYVCLLYTSPSPRDCS